MVVSKLKTVQAKIFVSSILSSFKNPTQKDPKNVINFDARQLEKPIDMF